MSTIVGTNIEVTNIKFDSDTTSMIISNTGQVTIQGEGTATTNLQQGLLKQWSSFGQGSQPFGANTAGDTFSTSSQTDESTAVVVVNLASNMGNTTYTGFNSPHHDRSNANKNYPKMGAICVCTTSSYKAVSSYANGYVDDNVMSSGLAGDLA